MYSHKAEYPMGSKLVPNMCSGSEVAVLQSSTDYSENLLCLYMFIKTVPFRHLNPELSPIRNTFFVSYKKALRAR